MSLSEIQTIAQNMIYEDAERDEAFLAYEEMYHNLWSLPEAIKQLPWIARIIDSSPYDAINTGVRLLAALPFSLHYQPLSPGTASKNRANMIERVVKWQMASANRRRSKSVESDVVLSSLLYDAVALEIIDLDYAIPQKQAVNASTKREEAVRSLSRFMVKTHSPRNVHVRQSGFMPEALLCVETHHAQVVIDEWGESAARIEGLTDLAMKSRSEDWVTVFDYWDIERRAVWLAEGNMGNVPEATHSQHMVILDESKIATNFIPWVANMGGSTLESDPLHRYKPILYPIYMTGVWDALNLVESLLVSEVTAHTGSPRFVETGTNPESGQVNYFLPDRIAKMPIGNELAQLAPPGMDAAMANIDALLASKIDKSTVSRILQGGEIPSGLAFATLNLATQTAVGVLKPAKDLSEKSLAEACSLFLLWTKHTGKPLLGYSLEKETRGAQMIIKPNEIDPSAIYITATLHPDEVLDRQQKIATASLAVRELGVSLEEALEQAGFSDPAVIIKQRQKELISDHILQMRFRKDMMEMEASVQMKIQTAQMEMQRAMLKIQAQIQAQMGAGGGGMQPPGGMGDLSTLPLPSGPQSGYQEQPAGIATTQEGGTRGPAVNPAGGGMSPALYNPEQTREMVEGEDILGNPTGY